MASVSATLNFVDRTRIPDEGFAFDFDPAWSGIPVTGHAVEIHDACTLAEPARLATHGFEQARLDCRPLADIDQAEVESEWGPAVCEAIRERTGADAVIRWAFSARYSERKTHAVRTEVSNPARRVHGDFAPTEFGTTIRHSLCQEQIAGVARGRKFTRWIGFNAWQPSSLPPYDTPLAVCDTRTVAPDDIVIGRGSAPSNRALGIDLPLFAHNPGTAGITIRPTRRTKPCCSSGWMPGRRTGGWFRTARSTIPPRRPMLRRAAASRCGAWRCFRIGYSRPAPSLDHAFAIVIRNRIPKARAGEICA